MNYSAWIVAALLGLAVAAPVAGAEDASKLGRLFFTPEKRALLERQRTQTFQDRQTLQGTTMSLDGVVVRSSGKATVWVNRQAQNEGESARTGVAAIVSSKTPGSALLAPDDDAATRLKVGETINRATGERDNRLGGGSVVTPAARGR